MLVSSRVLAVFFSFVFAGFAAQAEPRPSVDPSFGTLKALVSELMVKQQIPGVAVGIVKDGQLIFAEGFGQRDVNAGLPVTSKTLFAIGSTSKAFTATAAGILQDQGKLKLDKPIRDQVPDFRLFDDYATNHATLIDLMSHRTGVPRHDLAWYGFDNLPREYFWQRLRFLEPSASFRELWQYNNFMFMAAGVVIERVSNSTWEDFVRANILQPLGMNSTVFTIADMERSADFSRPYVNVNGTTTQVPMRPIVGMGLAGSINSNLEDMARWVTMNLDAGKAGNAQIVSAGALKQIHQPQMIVSGSTPRFPELTQASYGLGWMNQTYRGHKLVWHSGGIDGFITEVALLPDDGVGIIVFQNSSSAMVAEPLMYQAMDEALGLSDLNWGTKYYDRPAAPVTPVLPKEYLPAIRPLSDYAGTYSHPGYGEILITAESESLAIKFHSFDWKLKHLNNGTFELTSDDPIVAAQMDDTDPVYFPVDASGAVVAVKVKLEPSVEAIEFKKRD